MHWVAGRRITGLWIMPDEAIYARRALELWHHASLPLVNGQGAGYGILYPLVAGLPLTHSYGLLKLVQAFLVSLAAVPVFLYGRRLMPPGYALLAAALTVASPLLLYSGLVMTEVLYYPVAAAALLAVARAVETAATRDQALALAWIAVAILTRVQAVALLAVFAAAIAVDALWARDRTRLRAFWPVWGVAGAGAVIAILSPGVFGSYAGTLRGSYPLGSALALVAEHAAYLALTTGVVAALALLLLLAVPLDRRARAFLVTTACAVVLVVVQVGFFAARFAPHLLGRDLASLPPLLFLALALWLSRGAPRPNRYVTGALAFALLALLLAVPWDRLAVPDAFPDSFDLAPLLRLHQPADAVAVVALVLVAAAVFVPRRASLALVAVTGVALVVASVLASDRLAGAVAADQAKIVGPDPAWIDHAADGRVAFVYAGEAYWNTVWQETFWNRRVREVISLRPATVPGPLPQQHVTVPPSGRLPIRARYVVASDRLSFAGTPVAHLAQTGLDVTGLTLWRLSGAPRLSTTVNGVQTNGDIVGPATVDVYGCRSGRLELTLLPKATRELTIGLQGRPVLRTEIGGAVWHGSVAAHGTGGRCRFTIRGGDLLGSTRIAFVRG